MKLGRVTTIVLSFVLSVQAEVCLCNHSIDLHQEFKKNSVDADVIVQQVGDCLSVSIKDNGIMKEFTIDPYDVCSERYTWFPDKEEQLLLKDDKELSAFDQIYKKQLEINKRKSCVRYNPWKPRSTKEEEKLFSRDKELQKLQADYKKLNEKYYGDCYVSDIYVDMKLDYTERIYLDLSILNGAIKMRCSRESWDSKWKVVVYDTEYDGKLAIEADFLGMYDVKADKLIAHSNNNCLINFGTLLSKHSLLLSHFIENRGDICQLVDSMEYNFNSLCNEWKEDEFKRAALSTAIDSELHRRKMRGFFCTEQGRIAGDLIEAKGLDKVVLSGSFIQAKRLISDSTVRLGANLDDVKYRNTNFDTDNVQEVNIEYLSAPYVVLDAFKHCDREQAHNVEKVTVDHFIIKKLSSGTNIKYLSSVLYNPDNDVDVSKNEKKIRSILVGRNPEKKNQSSDFEDEQDSKKRYEYLVFKANDENFLKFLKDLCYPIVFNYIDKANPEYLAKIKAKQRRFVENDGICVYDEQSHSTEKVKAAIVDGKPYFYSPQGFMYDNYIMHNILMRSLGLEFEHLSPAEELNKRIGIIKVIKELLDFFNISLDDMSLYMDIVDSVDSQVKELMRNKTVLQHRIKQKPELFDHFVDISPLLFNLCGFENKKEFVIKMLQPNFKDDELRTKIIEHSKKSNLKRLKDEVDNFISKIKEAKKEFDPKNDPTMKSFINEPDKCFPPFLSQSKRQERIKEKKESLLNAYNENLREVEGYLKAMGYSLDDVSTLDLERSNSKFRRMLKDFFQILTITENICKKL